MVILSNTSFAIVHHRVFGSPCLAAAGRIFTYLLGFQIGSAHHDGEIHIVHTRVDSNDELLVIGVLMDASGHGGNMEVRISLGAIPPRTTSSCVFMLLT